MDELQNSRKPNPFINDTGLDHNKATSPLKKNTSSFVSSLGRDQHHNTIALSQELTNQRIQNYSPEKQEMERQESDGRLQKYINQVFNSEIKKLKSQQNLSTQELLQR